MKREDLFITTKVRSSQLAVVRACIQDRRPMPLHCGTTHIIAAITSCRSGIIIMRKKTSNQLCGCRWRG